MGKTINIGTGFGKYTYTEALPQAGNQDVFAMWPGQHSNPGSESTTFPDGWEFTLRGMGAMPSDTILSTGLTFGENTKITIENMTLVEADLAPEFRNILNVGKNSRIILKNVILKSNEMNTVYPNVYLHEGATATISNSEIYATGVSGVHTSKRSTLSISGSIVEHVFLREGSYAMIQNSRIQSAGKGLVALLVNNSSIVDATGVYLLTNELPPINNFLMRILEGAQFKASDLHFENNENYIDVDHGLMELKNTLITDDVSVVVEHDMQSTVEGEGLDIRLKEQREVDLVEDVTEESPVQLEEDYSNEVDNDPDFYDEGFEDEDNDTSVDEEPVVETGALIELNNMIGLASVKKATKTFINTQKLNRLREKQGLVVRKSALHSLFLGNPGTGKTSVARVLGKALYQEGVIRTNKFVEVSRKDLVSEYVGKSAPMTEEKLDEARGGILFVDEAYTLASNDAHAKEALETIMMYMENHRDDIMVIFAGYSKEMQDFMSVNPGMVSRVPNKFEFEDYNGQQIAEIGLMDLHKSGFNIDSEGYVNAIAKQYERTNDHSNGRWARNFNEKLIAIQADRLAESDTLNPNEIANIIPADIEELVNGERSDSESKMAEILQELDNLQGLESVKKFVNELVQKAEAEKKLAEYTGITSKKDAYHMVFSGAPGTGKTTVARLISKLFYNLGMLEKDQVIETNRAEMVGQYIGDTEKNTKNIIDRSMGGVLFIDEAYQLTNTGGKNDFGRQAVETLITELENNRDKFIVIFAGYTEDMDEFLTANAGLKSRIPHTIEFSAYTPEEVADIVDRVLSSDEIDWIFDHEYLKSVVANAYRNLDVSDQGNGRWARSFAEKVRVKHKTSLVTGNLDVSEYLLITNETIDSAADVN